MTQIPKNVADAIIHMKRVAVKIDHNKDPDTILAIETLISHIESEPKSSHLVPGWEYEYADIKLHPEVEQAIKEVVDESK